MITVSDPIALPQGDGTVELSADVNGERLWFRVPTEREPVLRAEPFIACLIIPAMATGQDIVVDPALAACPVFMAGMDRLMDVYRLWAPAIGQPLTRVNVQSATAAPPVGQGTLSFFSGGIDGLFTYLDAEPRVTDAGFAHGIDFQLDNPIAHDAVRRNRAWLATRATPLLEFASNARFVGRRFGVGWNHHNGLCLGGFAHALRAERCYVAGGHSWNSCEPHGSHLVSDPLGSSAATTILHHGFGPMRWQKLERIAREPGVLDLLRVCWQDAGYNCGRCEKCIRTMLLLHLLDLTAPGFPSTAKLADVVPDRITDRDGAAYTEEARVLAVSRGRDDAVRLFDRALGAWSRHRWLVRADAAFLGGALKRLRSAI